VLELKDFQQRAATQIAERFLRYYADPPVTGKAKTLRRVPFFQALASITASGKTVILADAVAAICAALPVDPVIIWLSKGRVVVEQTYANLSPGGRYSHLLAPMSVATLAEYDADTVREARQPSLFFATVGTFNQKDKEHGDRLIFKTDIEDTATASTWSLLKDRLDEADTRRPLLIVYDEAQNLSDQQTDLLLELQPDAFIVASATMRIPQKLSDEIKRLKDEGWTDDALITDVDPADVVEAGLVKSTVLLAGYEAPMEETIDAMLADLADATDQAAAFGLDQPKAIYVCKTNIVEGDAFRRDDPKRPFPDREAPPIVIWRYLTEVHDVPPEQIAVYASLKFDKTYGPPHDFVLFAGADKDYERFIAGNYTHVIFNLGLQEGWDDPLCYFAYIDKSMESNVAIEQVIGRVLRQPGAHHYASERLNTAHFYVRVDSRNVFKDVIDDVTTKLESDAPEVRLIQTPPGKPKPTPFVPRKDLTVHETAYDTTEAVKPVRAILDTVSDWRDDPTGVNTQAAGGRALVQRNIGKGEKTEFTWEEFEHTNRVSARWIFQREVMRRFPGALGIAPTDDPKFDALIGFNSSAYHQVIKAAHEVVDTYIDRVMLKQKRIDPYRVGPVLVRPDDVIKFTNSAHDGYSDLNKLEIAFARALDRTGYDWCRNPSRSGYGIPLITLGATRTFYPDFLVWVDDDVYALDTTAPHLLAEKTGRKLLAIAPPRGESGRLRVRFISAGRWSKEVEQLDSTGFSVWSLKDDRSLRVTPVDDIEASVAAALKRL
jgi:type III restriction enzyme